MQTQNYSRPFFKKALSRLRSLINLGDAKDRVSYELKQVLKNSKNTDPGLSKELETTLSTLDRVITGELLKKPMDRRRAEEYTAQTLTGKSYPLLATLLKDPSELDSENDLSIDELQSLAEKIAKTTYDMKHYENEREAALKGFKAALESFDLGDDNIINSIDELSPEMSMGTLAGYLHSLFFSTSTYQDLHIDISGIEGPYTTHHGLHQFKVNIKIFNSKNVLSIDVEYKSSEYETWDEFFSNVELNGKSLAELIDGDLREDGKYLIDEFSDFVFGWFTNQFQVDNKDVSNPFSQERKAEREALLVAARSFR